MANITLRFSGDPSSYGDDATREDMDALNALMVEYLQSQGHDVELGMDTTTDQNDHEWDHDGPDATDELRQLMNEA